MPTADCANVAERMAGMAAMAQVANATYRADHYRFDQLKGHAGEQLLLEMLKAVGCTEQDWVYQGLLEHITAAESQRAKARKLAGRRRRGLDQ